MIPANRYLILNHLFSEAVKIRVLSSLGDSQKWFCYEKISWFDESEIDPGKLLGLQGYLFRANVFMPSTTLASSQRQFRLFYPWSRAIAQKSQRHTGPATGATLMAERCEGLTERWRSSHRVRGLPDFYILCMTLTRQWCSVTYHMLPV